MKNYDQYALEDFVQDFDFRQWALGILDPRDTFWETWCKSNPDKELLVQQACSMIIGLAYEPEEYDASEVAQAISSIQKKLHKPPFFQRKWFSYAAAILAPVVTIMAFWFHYEDSVAPRRSQEPHQAAPDIRWKVNDGNETENILLADGSSVKLAPKSRLGLTTQFGSSDRYIWLEGEASFEVVKKADQPFIVHSHNILTKVLGTVFQVKAYEHDENVSVSVTSGKVTVLKQTAETGAGETTAEMVLTPNQQAVVSRTNDKIIKTLVEAPSVIRQPDHYPHFKFNDAPISEVFNTLEQSYGISIAYDGEKLAKCNLTARLSKEDLFEKLDMICETIQASYRVADGQILISGAGCE